MTTALAAEDEPDLVGFLLDRLDERGDLPRADREALKGFVLAATYVPMWPSKAAAEATDNALRVLACYWRDHADWRDYWQPDEAPICGCEED